jgi:hypothetical protein
MTRVRRPLEPLAPGLESNLEAFFVGLPAKKVV